MNGYDLLNVFAVPKLPDVVLERVGLTLAGTETEAEAVSKSDSRSKLRTAADYMNATIKLAEIANSMDASWQYQQLKDGTQQLICGLHAFLSKLEMMPKDHDGAATVAPRLRHREHKCANLIKIVKDFGRRYPRGLSLPKIVEETLLFTKRVAESLAEFPQNFGLWKIGSEDQNSGYIRKHIAGKFIERVRGHTPSDLWDAWTLEQVLMVTLDRMNLPQGATQTWDGQQIKRNFAVSSFMLSCWACLFHAADSKYGRHQVSCNSGAFKRKRRTKDVSRVCARLPDYFVLFEAHRRFRCAPGVGMSSCCCGLDYSRVCWAAFGQ